MRTSRVIVLLLLPACEVVFPLESASCPGYEALDIGEGKTGFYRFGGLGSDTSDDPPRAFLDAEGSCGLDGAHLAVVGSPTSAKAELNVLVGRYAQLGDTMDVFIGLSNTARADLTYQWITDEDLAVPVPGMDPWGTGQPMNPVQNQCGEIDHQSGRFRSERCDIADSYVCECDGKLADPTRF